MLIAVACFGAAMLVFAVSTSVALSVVALAVTGAADMFSVVIRQSLVQLETPDEMRGRVSAVNTVFIGASNQIGEFESGVTAAWLGAVGSVVLGGIGTLVVVAIWASYFPALRDRDRLVPRDPGARADRSRAGHRPCRCAGVAVVGGCAGCLQVPEPATLPCLIRPWLSWRRRTSLRLPGSLRSSRRAGGWRHSPAGTRHWP